MEKIQATNGKKDDVVISQQLTTINPDQTLQVALAAKEDSANAAKISAKTRTIEAETAAMAAQHAHDALSVPYTEDEKRSLRDRLVSLAFKSAFRRK